MELKVVWSAFAETQLDEIFAYYSKRAGIKVASKIVRALLTAPDNLLENPYLGQVEELLLGRKESYRYLIYTNYKILYSIDITNGLIKIADVFDVRQNPTKLTRNE